LLDHGIVTLGGVAAPRHLRDWQRIAKRDRDAFTGLLRVHRELVPRLDGDLERAHGLSLSSYDILVKLSHGGDEGRGMGDLADAALVTASGVTRIVERLERDGLAERSRAPDDERRTVVRITSAGLDLLARATPFHLAGVRELFLDRLSVDEREQLASIFGRLRAHPAPAGPRPRGRGRS